MLTEFIHPQWPAPPQVHAFTTTRALGNLATHVALDEKQAIHNRQTLVKKAHCPIPITWLTQEHGTTAILLPTSAANPVADACYTSAPKQICAVLTADCLPLLLCQKNGLEVAAIHAGWRGLLKGVIQETLKQLSSPAEELLVWLGPAIGPLALELPESVYQDFCAANPSYASAFSFHREGHCLADLYQLARTCLTSCRITQVYGGEHCTYSDPTYFYSYRREKEQSGRMASLIWIDPQNSV